MRVRAVAGVDDVAVERGRDALGETRFGVAHDEHAHAHCGQRDRRIFDGFALRRKAQVLGGKVDDVGAQAKLGDVERRERARTLFEEQVCADAAVEQLAGRLALELRGPLEDIGDLGADKSSRSMRLRRIRIDRYLVRLREGSGASETLTCSRRLVGMKRPT